jgi:hypothetical protein
MAYRQIAVGSDKQMKQFDGNRRLNRSTIFDNILMACEFLFGCWHRTFSRPFTLSGWTYEVCLHCGKEFAYNRAEIGCGLPKREKVSPTEQSWNESRTRVSLLAELR